MRMSSRPRSVSATLATKYTFTSSTQSLPFFFRNIFCCPFQAACFRARLSALKWVVAEALFLPEPAKYCPREGLPRNASEAERLIWWPFRRPRAHGPFCMHFTFGKRAFLLLLKAYISFNLILGPASASRSRGSKRHRTFYLEPVID